MIRNKKLRFGDKVRYRPGTGTYGYEDCLEADGRLPAEVVGFTPTRVRLKFLAGRIAGKLRAVDAASLKHADVA